ncbi:MAG: nucleotidyltransferase family protein [Chromatiaceae bacterium]|nr:nucleotidyltransferase family protein [Chromatiaceae bacterium]
MNGVVGVLLAAGAARRFGAAKLLHPLPGGEAIGITAARALIAALPDVVAVIRPGDQALHGGLDGLGLRVIENPRAAEGIGTSIAAGVAAAPQASGWLIALADMPFIRPATVAALADALRGGASIVAPQHAGRRGHPVGFAARWREDLCTLDGDRGARGLITAYAAALTLLPTDDPGVLRDVDRMEDLPTG